MKKCEPMCLDKPKDVYKNYHYINLKNFLMNWIIWENLPDSIDSRFLNDSLIMRGFVTAFKYSDGQIYVTDGAISGIDEYYRPTDFKSANIKFKNIKRKIDKDCVVCYNTYDYTSPYSLNPMLTIYANRLAELDLSVDTSIKNSRVAIIPTVRDEKEAIRVANILKRIYDGESAVLSYNNIAFDGSSGIDIFPVKAKDNIVVSELADARRSIMADFYKELGVNCLALDKKERTNLMEMESQDQQLKVAKEVFLEPRQRFCDKVNELFGLNISVKLNEEMIKEAVADVNSTNISASGNDSEA